MLCEYGCGNKAIFQLKNGKKICCDSPNKCPSIRLKNSEKQKITYKFPRVNPANIKVNCIFCKEKFSISNIKKHSNSCFLNPKNLRLCPICNNPIKDYKNNKTCSSKCGKQYFLSMYTRIGTIAAKERSETIPDNELGYRKICFRYHKKECIVCGEKNIVEVHHYDNNHKNNDPENLIPLCSTHHRYIRSRFEKLIINIVNEYHNNYVKKY